MAQFSQLIITKSGQDLLAKVLVDGGKIEFTRVAVSEMEIVEENLEQLTELPEIKQESGILNIVKTSSAAVKVEASFSNRELSAGYFMRTLGLYAKDGGSEVLYAAAAEVSGHCFMPAYNGVTVSGALIQLVTAVGNTENISFEVDPAGTATIARVSEDIAKHNSDATAHAGMFAEAEHMHSVSDITDFPTSLPANGGNADTVGNVAVSSNDEVGLRKISAGTDDLTAGTSALETGAIYLVYE